MVKNSGEEVISKVPAVTLGFWIIKVLCTTLGETGGDTLSMSWNLGYAVSTAIFVVPFMALVWAQIEAKEFKPWLYWATIVASTMIGTTIADFATRSMGIGYPGGSLLLLGLVMASLAAWKAVLGTVDVNSIATPRAETFYWLTITFSQTLGTALGDWTADGRFGYLGAAVLFSLLLAMLAVLYRWTSVSHVALFWAAFILTRPLGATVGDFLDKPLAKGGLDLSRLIASLVLAAAIAGLIALLPQRAGGHPGSAATP